jgi:transposase
MRIIGCDLHTRQQTIAMFDTETKEVTEITLNHQGDAVRQFYGALPRPVQVGIEATGAMFWFLQLLQELDIPCLVGHPAAIRKAETRKQKHDRRDAALLLRLQVEKRFPTIWMPSAEQRDLRHLLLHRHQLVSMRSRVQHALQSLALSHGLRLGPRLWNRSGVQALSSLPLAPHTTRRRNTLQRLQQHLDQHVLQLDQRVAQQASQRPASRLLMTHPGVGPVTALATEVFLGDAQRFPCGKALASYVGMIPGEHSSGGRRQRLGALSKQGNPFLRFLWVEATLHAVKKDAALRRFYRRKLLQKGLGKARVAAARKLGIRLWIMLREHIDYTEFCRRGQQRKSGGAYAEMPAKDFGPVSA